MAETAVLVTDHRQARRGAAHAAATPPSLINGRQRDLGVRNMTLPAGGPGETVNTDRRLKAGNSCRLETVTTPDSREALTTNGW